jgi:branched-chain amino acid aminotransferase
MSIKVYINGQFFDREEAKVSVFDHGFLYGDGVFEGLRAYSGKIFREKAHIDRLFASARAIALTLPMTPDEISEAMNRTITVNKIEDGYIRLVATRGIGTLGLDAHLCANSQVIVIADHLALYPKEFYEKGLEIVTASTVRINPAALSPQVKSMNYMNNILAKIEGHNAGCEEVLLLNSKGEVAECSGDNIFVVKNEILWTPPTDAGILNGITRCVVLELAKELGIKTKESPMTRYDVYTADEIFLTGSASELIPVVKIDARAIGNGKPGAIFKKLLERFRQETRG